MANAEMNHEYDDISKCVHLKDLVPQIDIDSANAL